MPVNFLISTVNGKFNAVSANILPQDVILIDQVSDASAVPTPQGDQVFSYREKGVSRSRNRAVSHARDEICAVSDDDVVFVDDAGNKIEKAFLAHPKADIITFQSLTPEGSLRKKYPEHARWHNTRSIMSVSSIEIAFRLSSLQQSGLRFDERFGLGAKYPSGEENIFLLDALRKGLKIRYVPVAIAIHPTDSSGSNLNDDRVLNVKGAVFARMFGWGGWVVAVLFALKKKRGSNKTLGEISGPILSGWWGYMRGK